MLTIQITDFHHVPFRHDRPQHRLSDAAFARRWLNEDHLARFIVKVIDQLDLSNLTRQARKFDTFIEYDQAFLSASHDMYAQGLQMGQSLRNVVLDTNNGAAYRNLDESARDFEASSRRGRTGPGRS